MEQRTLQVEPGQPLAAGLERGDAQVVVGGGARSHFCQHLVVLHCLIVTLGAVVLAPGPEQGGRIVRRLEPGSWREQHGQACGDEP
jgi:hypothetical protein